MDDDNTVGIADTQMQAATFEQIVMFDVRGLADADQQQMLRAPENVSRWLAELAAVGDRIQAQLTGRKANLDEEYAAFQAERTTESGRRWRAAKIAYGRWHTNATRILAHVRERQREARALRHQYATEAWDVGRAGDPKRRPLNDSVDELRSRIDRLEARLARLAECAETAGVAA